MCVGCYSKSLYIGAQKQVELGLFRCYLMPLFIAILPYSLSDACSIHTSVRAAIEEFWSANLLLGVRRVCTSRWLIFGFGDVPV